MHLIPKDHERLLIFLAAELARSRKEHDVKLNHPEAVAYITDWICERARDGEDVATVSSEASSVLEPEDVMEGVPSMIDMIQVEPVFPTGRNSSPSTTRYAATTVTEIMMETVITRTEATTNDGVDNVIAHINKHALFASQTSAFDGGLLALFY